MNHLRSTRIANPARNTGLGISLGSLLCLWLAMTAAGAATNSLTGLASQARPGFLLGSFASGLDKTRDPRWKDFFQRNFNIMTVGVYMFHTQPKANGYDFKTPDALMKFAREHGQKVYFHPLVGGAVYNPKWINDGNLSAAQLSAILQQRITTILTRYQGRVDYVDVVNEALTGTGMTADGQFDWNACAGYGGHVWMTTMGMYHGKKFSFPQYLVDAFRVAREAGGPQLKLILNEWGNATLKSQRGTSFLKLVQALREEGIPVDGAGLQLHCRLKNGELHEWESKATFDFASFDAMLREYEKAGIEVHITEFDIHLPANPTAQDFERQGKYYAEILRHAIASPAVKSFKTWGFCDKYSWKADQVDGHPLMLDEKFQPKPAYLRTLEMLKTAAAHPNVFQAENAAEFSGCTIRTNHAGFSGAGLVAMGTNGSWFEWTDLVAPSNGIYQVSFRYANGNAGLNFCRLALNGRNTLTDAPPRNVIPGDPHRDGLYAFCKTGGWEVWRELVIGMNLKAGRNTLRITVENPLGGPVIDQIALQPNGPQQQAPPDSGATGWARVPEILARIKPPTISQREFLVTDYGAVGDSETDSRAAINDAIRDCHASGGGRVIVPAGSFRVCGMIRLLSDVELHLRAGARLDFRGAKSNYEKVLTTTEGNLCYTAALIYAADAVNIAITGEGPTSVIDGGQAVVKWNRGNVFYPYGDVGLPPAERPLTESKPHTVDLFRCQNVLLDNYRLVDAPFWCNVVTSCTNVAVKRLEVESLNVNNDGIDVQSCRDVLIEDCRFHTGDDGICLKAGRDRDGREILGPCQDVVIRRNTTETTCSHLGLGSEMAGGLRNVFVEQNGANGRVLIKSNYDRGGYIQDFHLRDCAGVQHIDFIFNNYNYRGYYHPAYYSDFSFENLPGLKTLSLFGRAENPIHNVRVKNCGQPAGARQFVDGLIIE